MNEPDFIGTPPSLAGHRCTGLVVREFWYQGQLSAPACVVWLRADDDWHRLCIDCGVVFWRRGAPDSIPDDPHTGYSYPLVDLGKSRGLEGLRIAGCTTVRDGGEVRVSFAFENGESLNVIHHDDVTRYAG